MNHPNASIAQRLRKLTLIPLAGGRQWTGLLGIPGGVSAIYFPTTGNVPIPDNLALHLLQRSAAANSVRKEMYTKLGVEECPVKVVLRKIKEAHQRFTAPVGVDAHLRYLFHHHEQPDDIRTWIWVPVSDNLHRKASFGKLWFSSNDEYDLWQLVPMPTTLKLASIAYFLAKSLLENVHPERSHDMSWEQRLAFVTGAQYIPRVVKEINLFGSTRLPRQIAPELRAVLQHNPGKFLGTLKAHWATYQLSIDEVMSDLRLCKVPCKNSTSHSLCETYLPTAEVIDKITDLELLTEDFPVLTFPITPDDPSCRQWQFLEQLGVSSKLYLQFFETALQLMSYYDPAPEMLGQCNACW